MSGAASSHCARGKYGALAPMPTRVLARKCACGNHGISGGECAECRKKHGSLERKPESPHSATRVPEIVHEVLRSPGRPLAGHTRAFMEPRFERDLSSVRIHADGRARESARAVNAKAYTVGNDIVWGANAHSPESPGGRQLLAHELVHTVQQGNAARGPLEIASTETPAERQADAAANRVVGGTSVPALTGGGAPALQRAPIDASEQRTHGKSTLPYKQATEFAECTRIMGSENLEFCERTVLKEKVKDASLSVRIARVKDELAELVAGATWKQLRKVEYPKASAPGIQRAKDRKAGSLPDLTGLGKISTLEHFAGLIRNVQRSWLREDSDANAKKLGAAASTELQAADVPGFLVVEKQKMPFKGFFMPHFWSFTISEELVTRETLEDSEIAELANVTLHESRHAEQRFLAARFSAGIQHKNAASIVQQVGIPAAIAREAVAKKFDSTTDPKVLALGSRMFDAMVTSGRANQATSNASGVPELEAMHATAEKALAKLKTSPSSRALNDAIKARNALRAQVIEVQKGYPLYRAIPYEADAHEVGDAEEQAFKGWK